MRRLYELTDVTKKITAHALQQRVDLIALPQELLELWENIIMPKHNNDHLHFYQYALLASVGVIGLAGCILCKMK